MSDLTNWAFPEHLQPKAHELEFDLSRALDAMVQVRSEIPEDAFTASILGTERIGNGVVINADGLVLTVGYLITEAQSIWLTTNSGAVVAGYPLAYDFATGFGLIQPLGRLALPALERGSTAGCAVGADLIVVGHGGRAHALKAKLIAKREFAGYWEYLLDEALFTAPAHRHWGGTAVLDTSGRMIGIGSLLVEELVNGKPSQGNMVVPIDLLEPILQPLLTTGQSARPPRPWLGMYTTEAEGRLVIADVAQRGPAQHAGLRRGDIVAQVAGEPASSLADFLRKVWALGPAGTEIPLSVSRDGNAVRVTIRSANRDDFLWKPQLH